MTDPEGIRFLDHTADVGIDVSAPTLERLFHRAGVGMLMLLRGQEEEAAGEGIGAPPSTDALPASRARRGPSADGEAEVVSIQLEADNVVRLLVDWLRELLFLHETRHADYVRASFEELTEATLRARVETAPGPGAVREIKGVTYHELTVEATEAGWHGRVIFDV